MGASRRGPRSAALALVLWALFAGGAQAEKKRTLEVIERVAATVNDEAIYLSDVRKRAVPYLAQVMQATSAVERQARMESLYSELLERMIDDELMQQAADRMKIRVSREDVDRAIANARAQSGLTEAAFLDAVKAQGLTEDEFRRDVRRQLMRVKVLNQRSGDKLSVTEADVRKRYEEQSARASRSQRVHLSHLFLPVAPSASAKEVAGVRDQIAALRGKVNAENFITTMETHAGGDLGWLLEADLPDGLRSAVVPMKTGDVSEPVRGPNGFHILYLVERQRGDAELPNYDEARKVIEREMLEQAVSKQQNIVLAELRRDAIIEKKLQ